MWCGNFLPFCSLSFFTLFMWAFIEQKILILMKSNLSGFPYLDGAQVPSLKILCLVLGLYAFLQKFSRLWFTFRFMVHFWVDFWSCMKFIVLGVSPLMCPIPVITQLVLAFQISTCMPCLCAVWGFSASCSSPWPLSGSLSLARGNPEVREQIRSCREQVHSQTTGRWKTLGEVPPWVKNTLWGRGYLPLTGEQSRWGDVSPLDSAKISYDHWWHYLNFPFS